MRNKSPFARNRGRVALPALLFVVLIVGLGVCSFLITKSRGDWANVYLPAGLAMRNGQDIFRNAYVYPPFQAFIAAPFTFLPPIAARTAWAFLNAIAAAVFLLSAWRIGGGRLLWSKVPNAELCICALGLAASIGFLFDAITNGQTDLILAALISGGYLLGRSGRIMGSVLIGVAAAAKCTPLIFVPWLLLRRGWRAAIVAGLAALAVNLLPDLIFPAADGKLRLVAWIQNYLAALLDARYVPGTWYTAMDFNHSLSGFFNRLLPGSVLRLTWAVSATALLAIAALEFLRAPRLPGVNSLPAGIERFEIGMLFCLMLLLSPVSSKPHFCMLLIPAWAVAREALLRRDRFLLAVTFLSAFAGLAANKDLVGKTIYDAVKWSGVITLETLMLFTACLWAHWRRTQDTRLSDSNA